MEALEYNKNKLRELKTMFNSILKEGEELPSFNETNAYKLAELQERWYVSKLKANGYKALSVKDLDKDHTHKIDLMLGDFMITNHDIFYHIDLKLPTDDYEFGTINQRSVNKFEGHYLMPNKTNTVMYIIPHSVIKYMVDNWYINWTTKDGEKFLSSTDLFDGRLQSYIDKGYVLKLER